MSTPSRTQEFRELLDRTGVLFTQASDDPGHISEAWRKKILELCDLVDSGAGVSAPRDVGQEDPAGVEWELRQRLSHREAELDHALEKARTAVTLVYEATPRVKALNNAMSTDWRRRADEFLGDLKWTSKNNF